MKKKTLALLLSMVMSLGMLTACGDANEEVNASVATETEEATTETIVEENHDGMYRSELTNEWIDESLKNQRPVAILVDNEKIALDHYGLTQADIVYEMMNSTANGEITRFMAIVKDYANITRFGSIRSARPTNFKIAPEYNAILIHDGGPYYIDAYISNPWVDNLSGDFARIPNGKSREYTEYVTTGEIEERMAARKMDVEYNEHYQGPHWLFSDDDDPTDLSAHGNSKDCTYVALPFPHNDSMLEYDKDTGKYYYSEYGAPHIDLENGNKQLSFTNVILQCAELIELDENGYMEFDIIMKKGQGYYITGGKAVPVTWEKLSDTVPTRFYYGGKEIYLNTGKTYIALVSEERWDELVIE